MTREAFVSLVNMLKLCSTKGTVDLGNFVPLFNFSMCNMSSIYPKR